MISYIDISLLSVVSLALTPLALSLSLRQMMGSLTAERVSAHTYPQRSLHMDAEANGPGVNEKRSRVNSLPKRESRVRADA